MADGTDRPVVFASRTVAPAEKNYARIKREGFAIVLGVRKFHKHIYGTFQCQGKQYSVSIVNETPINASRIAQVTTRDPVLSKVVKFVKTGGPRDVGNELSPYMRRKDELSV